MAWPPFTTDSENIFTHPLEGAELNPDLPEQDEEAHYYDVNTSPIFPVGSDERVTMHTRGNPGAFHTRNRFSPIELTLAALQSKFLVSEKTYYMRIERHGDLEYRQHQGLTEDDVIERVRLRWVREL